MTRKTGKTPIHQGKDPIFSKATSSTSLQMGKVRQSVPLTVRHRSALVGNIRQ
nr:MAG TPA: hypothetical protein [Caudoviricetes sp.]